MDGNVISGVQTTKPFPQSRVGAIDYLDIIPFLGLGEQFWKALEELVMCLFTQESIIQELTLLKAVADCT